MKSSGDMCTTRQRNGKINRYVQPAVCRTLAPPDPALFNSHALVEFIYLFPLPDFKVCRSVLVLRLGVHYISLEIFKESNRGIKIEEMTGPSWSDK